MSPITATVAAEDTVARALLLMVKEKLPRLPVMQGSRVVGLIRQSELFQVISDHVLKER
jgi:predicted transcriptional regulator